MSGKRATYEGHTLDEAALRWWDTEGQYQRSQSVKQQVRALIPYIKGRPLREAPAAAQDGRMAWKAEGLSDATIHRRLGILKRICTAAYRDWGWLDAPVGDRIALPRLRNARHVYLMPDEVERIVEACADELVGEAIRLAAWTGLRRGELLALLRCEAHQYRDNCIILDGRTKSGRPRVIPVPPRVAGILERRPVPITKDKLFFWWSRARVAAGFSHVRWHDLRHSYASWLMQSGVNARAIQDLMGHASLGMVQRYSHLAPQHLVDAVATMEASVAGENVIPITKGKKTA